MGKRAEVEWMRENDGGGRVGVVEVDEEGEGRRELYIRTLGKN